MKKLTAGIFATILGLTAMGAADAAVTSKAYVDAAVATKADQSALTTEIQAREAADTALGERIDGITTDLDGYVTEETFTTDQTRQDNLIGTKADQSALTTEIQAREAADTALGQRIDGITTDLNGYVTDQELANSQTAQDNANAAKYETIENVTAGLATKVDTETYTQGQTAQDNRITALETNSATKAELTTEATTRETKDNELQAAIEAIEGGFTDAEVSMDGVYALTMRKVGDDVTYYWEYIDRTYAADDLVSGTNPDSAEAEATQPQP